MSKTGKKAVDIRADLVRALELDLVGPENDGDLGQEVLPQSPSRWYLTGFLIPTEAGEAQRTDATSEEGVDEVSDSGGTDDAVPPEPASAKRAPFPSSLGLSLLVSGETQRLQAIVRWGDYRREELKPEDGEGETQVVWRRTPRKAEVWLDLPGALACLPRRS